MYVLLAYGYLGDRFQAWYLKLCIQSSNYVHTVEFTKLIIKFLSGKILLQPPKYECEAFRFQSYKVSKIKSQANLKRGYFLGVAISRIRPSPAYILLATDKIVFFYALNSNY